MLFPNLILSGNNMNIDEESFEEIAEHVELEQRLRKSLYYGRTTPMDRPSLPLTELAVEFLQESAPKELGRVDNFIASSIGREACVSPCSMMLGMLYIDRLKGRNPEYLQKTSSSDLFLISMMMASKYLYDEGTDEEVFNDEWAESGSMETEDINELERNFLNAIDWSLFTSPEDFQKWMNRIEQKIAYRKGKEKGEYTYMDLLVLTENKQTVEDLRKVLVEILKVMMVCSVAYITGTLTVMGSVASVLYARQQIPVIGDISLQHGQYSLSSKSVVNDNVPSPLSNLWESSIHEESTGRQSPSGHYLPHPKHDEPATETFNKLSLGKQSFEDGEVIEYPYESQTQVHLPGLLTLALLKDTVIQFFLATRERYTELTAEKRMGNHNLCTCGHCLSTSNKSCRNVTGNSDTENGANLNFHGKMITCFKERTTLDKCYGKRMCCCDQPLGGSSVCFDKKLQETILDIPLKMGTMTKTAIG